MFIESIIGHIKKNLRKLILLICRNNNLINNIQFNSNYLSKICNPRIVVDVGVGHGTYSLYKAYPNAHFLLFEPLLEFKDSIKKIKDNYSCEVYYKALGEKFSKIEINVDKKKLTKSSFAQRLQLTKTGNPLEKREVDVITLNSLFSKMSLMEGPILLKIDTEGNELAILRGATKFLKLVDTVILEVSIAKRFHNSYEFEDVIYFMNENGFYLYSFLEIFSVNKELRPRYADIVFKYRTDN